jgi:cytoskeleton protein RodZ
MSSQASRQTADLRDSPAGQLRRVGGVLREARQARGEDLYAVAEALRIKPSYLFALEEGDLGMTPGRPYALGFLRTYADHLGFDGAEVVRLVKQTLDGAPPEPELVVPQPERDDRRPRGLLVAASILLAGLLYGGWHMLGRDQPVLERVAAVPGELGRLAGDLLGGPPSLPAPPPTRVAAAPPPPPPPPAQSLPTRPLPSPAPPEPAGLQVLVAPEPVEAVAAAPRFLAGRDSTSAQAAERPSAPAEVSPATLLAALDGERARPGRDLGGPAEGRVVLIARDSAWVQIRSASRDYVRTRTLDPGERLVLPERDDLALWTGNAGGIEVVVEGRSLGLLGETGKVVRDVPLVPGPLRARLGQN